MGVELQELQSVNSVDRSLTHRTHHTISQCQRNSSSCQKEMPSSKTRFSKTSDLAWMTDWRRGWQSSPPGLSASNEKFMIQLELPGFSPEDFSLKTKDDVIIIEAKHNAKTDDGSTDTRHFTKEFKMQSGVATDQLGSTYSGAGILTISAPRSIAAPEGAQVSEAMKAQSQAYVTDDGVAVKKDDKASSQSIAATTQSEDGSTISSF